ncbi:MFS transporter [Rhodococcus daqingensis]|uniref:MFS transporter n=1 Tax=Rhodococcus daqingensis TaxID=2479363 RepID=A0ABW2RYX6_9NOCA
MSVHIQAEATEASDDGWSPRLVMSLISMALVLEIMSISFFLVTTAFKPIGEHFQTDQLAWVMSTWLLVAAIACPLAGKLADIYGKRKLFLISLGLGIAGAVLSAVAPSFALFLVGRALFGCLIACMFLAYSLMRDVFPPSTLGLSVSITAAGMGLMSVPAPFLTGWLLDTWSFRAIFWFFAIVLVAMIPIIVTTTPESPVRTPARVDVLGAILLGGGLASVLIGVSFGPTWGWGETSTLGYLIGGVALLAAWVATSLRAKEPLIDLRFFRHGPMFRICLGAGLGYGTMSLYTIMLPIMCMTPAALALGYGFGVDAKQFAILQAPIGLGSVIGGLGVGRAIRTMRPSATMIIGMGLMLAGSALTAFSHTDKALLVIWVLLFGLGMGAFTASIPNLVIASVPATVQASMSSMVQTSQTLIASIFPVAAFAILNSYVATVVDGYAFYTGGGISLSFLIAAAGSALSILVVAGLLRRRTRETTDGHAPTTPAVAVNA